MEKQHEESNENNEKYTKEDVLQILDKMDESNRSNMTSMKKVVIIICATFLISNLLMAFIIIYKDYKAYDYDYEVPDNEIVNINGDSNSDIKNTNGKDD